MRKRIVILLMAVMMVGMLACNGQQGNVTEETSAAEEKLISEESVDASAEENASQSEESQEIDYVSDMTLEEALAAMDAPETQESLYFEEEVGKVLYNAVTPQENAMDFTGEWNRTNVPTYHYGKITISNQDETGFDVDGAFLWYANCGDIVNERAYFVTENLAIYEIYNDWADDEEYGGYAVPYEYIAFKRTEDGLQVYATGIGGEIGAFSVNCFAHGEFVAGEPTYTNANILKETYTDEQLTELKKLMGEELYEKWFVTTTEYGRVEISGCVLEDDSIGLYYRGYVPGVASFQYYNLIICDNGNIYGDVGPDGTFFSNVSGVTEPPEFDTVERYMTYREFKNYLKEIMPDIQAGEAIELSTELDYYFVLRDELENSFQGEKMNRLEDSYVIKHPAGKMFLIFHIYNISTGYEVRVYDITSDSGDDWGRTEYMGRTQMVGEVGIERIETVRTLYKIGTYQSYKDYALDENGHFVELSEGYIFEPHESGNLKVIKELPVIIDGEECIIKPGEEIVITGCPSDGSKEIYFRVVSTGEEGIISYKKTTTEFFEIAGVSHYDYFENVLEFSD